MITIETYILHDNDFVKVAPDTDIHFITDTFYIEGAIVIKVFGQEVLGLRHWDLVDQLWSYFIDAVEELLNGRQEAGFLFPDQPLSVELRVEKKNRDRLLINIGGKKYAVDKREFLSKLLSAAEIFYGFLGQCVDSSILLQKVQKLRNHLL